MPLVMLGLGGCAFWRRLLAVLLTESVCFVSSGLIADSTLATISIHTGPTPPLTPQTMFDACIQNFFQVSTLYRVGGGGGELQENFEKDALIYEGTEK